MISIFFRDFQHVLCGNVSLVRCINLVEMTSIRNNQICNASRSFLFHYDPTYYSEITEHEDVLLHNLYMLSTCIYLNGYQKYFGKKFNKPLLKYKFYDDMAEKLRSNRSKPSPRSHQN